MKIAIFGYDFDHYKTNAIVKDTFNKGFKIGALFLAPKINFSENGEFISFDNKSKNFKIREFCKINKIPFYRIKHDDFEKISYLVDTLNINIGLIAGAKIIKPAVINLFKDGIINYHPGKIPETSGLDSIYRTIECFIPPFITAHKIDRKIDAGYFIMEAKVDVFEYDSLDDIKKRILDKQIVLNNKVLMGIKKKIFSFKKINRPKKNEKLNQIQKDLIMNNFKSWKKFYKKK